MSSNVDSLLERHLPALRAFVRLRCNARIRARESASDVVQSVCRELLDELPRLQDEGEAAFRQWLFMKALDKVRDRYRYHHAQKRDVRAEEAWPSAAGDALFGRAYATIVTPSRHAMGHEEIERIEQAFDQLPEQYREIISLSRLVGLSNTEIAEQLDVPLRTVTNALYRGLRRLSWILSSDGEDSR